MERTRLEGVADHVTIHANHAELIRAPLLFADPGPVACMPDVLRWLEEDREKERQKTDAVKNRSPPEMRRCVNFPVTESARVLGFGAGFR